MHLNSVRFEKLHLYKYGVFQGLNDFVFDPHRTLIIGGRGIGKTTIVHALMYLGPAPVKGMVAKVYVKFKKLQIT